MANQPTQDLLSDILSYAAPQYSSSYNIAKKGYNMARSYIKSRRPLARKRTSKKAAGLKKKLWRAPRKAMVAGGQGQMTDHVMSNLPISLNASASPFPQKMIRTLTWRGTPYYSTAASVGTYVRVLPNCAYDPDLDNLFGNEQPLFFDQFCAATGPYNSYIVKKWTCTWQIINGSAYEMEVLLDQGTTLGDSDTLVEVRARPNIMRNILAASGAEGCRCEFVMSGTCNDFRSDVNDETLLAGSSTSNPSDTIGQTLWFNNVRAALTHAMVMIPTIMMEIQFFNNDSVAS